MLLARVEHSTNNSSNNSSHSLSVHCYFSRHVRGPATPPSIHVILYARSCYYFVFLYPGVRCPTARSGLTTGTMERRLAFARSTERRACTTSAAGAARCVSCYVVVCRKLYCDKCCSLCAISHEVERISNQFTESCYRTAVPTETLWDPPTTTTNTRFLKARSVSIFPQQQNCQRFKMEDIFGIFKSRSCRKRLVVLSVYCILAIIVAVEILILHNRHWDGHSPRDLRYICRSHTATITIFVCLNQSLFFLYSVGDFFLVSVRGNPQPRVCFLRYVISTGTTKKSVVCLT